MHDIRLFLLSDEIARFVLGQAGTHLGQDLGVLAVGLRTYAAPPSFERTKPADWEAGMEPADIRDRLRERRQAARGGDPTCCRRSGAASLSAAAPSPAGSCTGRTGTFTGRRTGRRRASTWGRAGLLGCEAGRLMCHIIKRGLSGI